MRPIEGEQPYVYLDGIVLKRTWAGEVRNVSLLVATSVNSDGYREILGTLWGTRVSPSTVSNLNKKIYDERLR
jgi:transposase-like protein